MSWQIRLRLRLLIKVFQHKVNPFRPLKIFLQYPQEILNVTLCVFIEPVSGTCFLRSDSIMVNNALSSCLITA